jgi:hypothetical protein
MPVTSNPPHSTLEAFTSPSPPLDPPLLSSGSGSGNPPTSLLHATHPCPHITPQTTGSPFFGPGESEPPQGGPGKRCCDMHRLILRSRVVAVVSVGQPTAAADGYAPQTKTCQVGAVATTHKKGKHLCMGVV